MDVQGVLSALGARGHNARCERKGEEGIWVQVHGVLLEG